MIFLHCVQTWESRVSILITQKPIFPSSPATGSGCLTSINGVTSCCGFVSIEGLSISIRRSYIQLWSREYRKICVRISIGRSLIVRLNCPASDAKKGSCSVVEPVNWLFMPVDGGSIISSTGYGGGDSINFCGEESDDVDERDKVGVVSIGDGGHGDEAGVSGDCGSYRSKYPSSSSLYSSFRSSVASSFVHIISPPSLETSSWPQRSPVSIDSTRILNQINRLVSLELPDESRALNWMDLMWKASTVNSTNISKLQRQSC